jgi:hypothetical protein
MSDHEKQLSCLGVICQNCGTTIPVPDHVLDRQIAVAEDRTDADGRYVTTLLNLRCRTCCKEYFYDVGEIISVEVGPRPFAHSAHARNVRHDSALELHHRAGQHHAPTHR